MSRADADRQVESAFERHKRGDLEHAHGVYRRVLAAFPRHAHALHYLGLIAQQTGHSREAATLLQQSIAVAPGDARAHNHLGQVYVALGDKRAATESFEKALEIDPDHVDSLNNYANVIKVRDLLQAVSLYRRALTLNPQAVLTTYNLAIALKENDEAEEAERLLRRVIELEPRHVRAHHSLASLLEQRGRFDEAVGHYLEVRRHDPRHVGSLASLFGIGSYEPDESMVKAARELIHAPHTGSDDLIKLHHGLGKHLDRAGRYEEAFAHFAASKAIVRQQAPDFDVAATARNFDRLMKVFTREEIARRASAASDSRRPVFIVGMPRSGTTLAEQILASHPQVYGAGELVDMPRIVKSLRPDYPECVPGMGDAALSELGAQYLRTIESRAPAEVLRVTDKMPVNFMHLGMIATLFPHARIVHCRRDARDVGLSCFIELFQLEHGYTADLATFGRYFLQYERLMSHWLQALPMPLHELRYERMVADPEGQSRALVAHCGLEWDAACLDFHSTERSVRTPSRWQVRQPVYSRSSGRWRNYEAQLAPLLRVLQEGGYDY